MTETCNTSSNKALIRDEKLLTCLENQNGTDIIVFKIWWFVRKVKEKQEKILHKKKQIRNYGIFQQIIFIQVRIIFI